MLNPCFIRGRFLRRVDITGPRKTKERILKLPTIGEAPILRIFSSFSGCHLYLPTFIFPGNDHGQTRAGGILRPFSLPRFSRNPVFSLVALTWREATPCDASASRPTGNAHDVRCLKPAAQTYYYVEIKERKMREKKMREKDDSNSLAINIDKYVVYGNWRKGLKTWARLRFGQVGQGPPRRRRALGPSRPRREESGNQ